MLMAQYSRGWRFDATFFLIALTILGILNFWFASRTMGSFDSSSFGVLQSIRGVNQNQKFIRDRQWRHKHEYNFTIGICAIVKDAEAYLTEWLDYHLGAMGIDAIYIYDNSFGNPDAKLEYDLQAWYRNTRHHPLYSKVEVMHMPSMAMRRQKMSYTDCVLRYGKNVMQLAYDIAEKEGYWNASTDHRTLDASDGIDYLAMIDADEFLVPQGSYDSVHEVVKDYLDPYVGGSLTVNWMLFGSSNRSLYMPIPVTKRFQYRDEKPFGVVKAIVQASDFGNMASPHSVNTLYGQRRTTSYKGAILQQRKGNSDPDLPSGALLLYHYRYTSHKEYYYKKCIRKETDGSKGCDYKTGRVVTMEELERKGKPTHIAMRAGSVFDDSAWKLFKRRVPKYRIYDDEHAWGDYS